MSNESALPLNDRTDAGEQARPGFNAPLLIVLGALAMTALLYWPTSLEIADLWEDTVRRRYTHGWIVLAVAVWLVWRDRAQLASIELRPPVGGWALVAVGSVGWLVGSNAGLLAMTTLGMPLLVLSAIWAAGGLALTRRVAFAVLFLYFAFPVWELISVPLQALTAFVSLWLTGMVGIPVRMDEFIIQIPEGWFEIAGGCNGLHFFIVALGIATLHGHIDRDDFRSRLLLLVLAGTLALVTNWLRVFIIIVAGHLTNMQHFLVRVNHYYFGWFLFAFALALYVYLSARLPRRSRVERTPKSRAPSASRRRIVTAAALTVAALALGPVWSLADHAGEGGSVALAPPTLQGWSGPQAYASSWRPIFVGADEEFLVAYKGESTGEVALYRAAYHSQRQGKELLGFGNSVVGERHRLTASTRRHVSAGGVAASISEQVVSGSDGQELLVWSLYAIDGRPDQLGLTSRLVYGVRALVAAPTASVIALAAECRPNCERARDSVQALWTAALPTLLASTGQNVPDTAAYAN